MSVSVEARGLSKSYRDGQRRIEVLRGLDLSVNAGEVLAVHVAYEDSPPATTDVTLSDEGDPASEAIVSLANANSDVKLYPRRLLETNDGTDLTYDGTRKVYGPHVVHGRLEATIAGANAGDSATITAWIKR